MSRLRDLVEFDCLLASAAHLPPSTEKGEVIGRVEVDLRTGEITVTGPEPRPLPVPEALQETQG